MLFLLVLKSKLSEKAFSNVKAKTNSSFVGKVTERSNYSFLLFGESRFSDICTILELKEPNWLCKHMKNVRSSQTCISMNLVLTSVKHKFFHVSIAIFFMRSFILSNLVKIGKNLSIQIILSYTANLPRATFDSFDERSKSVATKSL